MTLPVYSHAPSYIYRCTVQRVIDGDTFVGTIDFGFRQYMDRSVRLRDFDTPELNSRNVAERQHAQEAREFVMSILPVDSVVVLLSAKSAIYDRIEADVFYTDPKTGLQHSLADALRAHGFVKRDSYPNPT